MNLYINRLIYTVLFLVFASAIIILMQDRPEKKDNNPELYRMSSTLYLTGDNDTYSDVYYRSDGSVQEVMRDAADDLCDGILYEDFSCKGV